VLVSVGSESMAGVAVERWLLGRTVMVAMSNLAVVDDMFGRRDLVISGSAAMVGCSWLIRNHGGNLMRCFRSGEVCGTNDAVEWIYRLGIEGVSSAGTIDEVKEVQGFFRFSC
jgi:hypothetical protein